MKFVGLFIAIIVTTVGCKTKTESSTQSLGNFAGSALTKNVCEGGTNDIYPGAIANIDQAYRGEILKALKGIPTYIQEAVFKKDGMNMKIAVQPFGPQSCKYNYTESDGKLRLCLNQNAKGFFLLVQNLEKNPAQKSPKITSTIENISHSVGRGIFSALLNVAFKLDKNGIVKPENQPDEIISLKEQIGDALIRDTYDLAMNNPQKFTLKNLFTSMGLSDAQISQAGVKNPIEFVNITDKSARTKAVNQNAINIINLYAKVQGPARERYLDRSVAEYLDSLTCNDHTVAEIAQFSTLGNANVMKIVNNAIQSFLNPETFSQESQPKATSLNFIRSAWRPGYFASRALGRTASVYSRARNAVSARRAYFGMPTSTSYGSTGFSSPYASVSSTGGMTSVRAPYTSVSTGASGTSVDYSGPLGSSVGVSSVAGSTGVGVGSRFGSVGVATGVGSGTNVGWAGPLGGGGAVTVGPSGGTNVNVKGPFGRALSVNTTGSGPLLSFSRAGAGFRAGAGSFSSPYGP